MKLSKRALEALLGAFTYNGRNAYSGHCSDQGNPVAWMELERLGLVKEMRPSLGHRFSYEITPDGSAFLDEYLSK